MMPRKKKKMPKPLKPSPILIDDLRRRTEAQEKTGLPEQLDLFANFNGLADEARSTEFYQHDANWTNRMILGLCRRF